MGCREPYLDFLSDRKGVYGIGFPEGESRPLPIIIRPDCIYLKEELELPIFGALQQITTARLFGKTLEGKLLRRLHEKYLVRHGITLAKRDEENTSLKLESDRERRFYYGTRLSALRVLNRNIASLLEQAAPRDALTLARRYNLENRLGLYRAIVTSRRAFQLAECFPALAAALYGTSRGRRQNGRAEALALVEEGVPLKQVARAMNMPMPLRKIKPGVAYLAIQLANTFEAEPRLIHDFLPGTQSDMRTWLYAMASASAGGEEYKKWVARNALELGPGCHVASDRVACIGDWAQACEFYSRGIVDDFNVGARFVTRPLNRDMSVSTVYRLSDAWHRDVSQFSRDIETGVVAFPKPWLEGGSVGHFKIQPITDVVELREEGAQMKHCVATYASSVVKGFSYIYSVRKNEERIATLQLVRGDERGISIGQISGVQNSRVPGDVAGAVRRWASAGIAT
jgi:hypothetical protein